MTTAIIFAGGAGIRMKNSAKPKQFLELYGKPIIIYTLEIFESCADVDSIVVVCLDGWENRLRKYLDKYNITKVEKIVSGGKDTQASKMNALRYLKEKLQDDDIIILHDGVRPIIKEELISSNVCAVKEFGSAISAVPFSETAIVTDDDATTNKTIVRNTLYIAKAPQSFFFKDVWEAHSKGEMMPYEITIDTCSLMTELGKTLHIVPCESSNIKITTPEDYFVFKALVDMRESADIWGI